MNAKFMDPFLKVRTKEDFHREAEAAVRNGVNSEVVTYFLPLEEIWSKYGPPGDLNGYASPPMHGKSIRSER